MSRKWRASLSVSLRTLTTHPFFLSFFPSLSSAALCTYQAGLFAPDLAAIAAPGFLEIGDAFTGGLDTAGGEASTGLEGIGDAFSNLGNKLDNVDLPDINCAPM